MSEITDETRISELQAVITEADRLYAASMVGGLPTGMTLEVLRLRARAVASLAAAVDAYAA